MRTPHCKQNYISATSLRGLGESFSGTLGEDSCKWEVPVAGKRFDGVAYKKDTAPGNLRSHLFLARTHDATFTPAEIGVFPARTAEFDPLPFLRELSPGRSGKDYRRKQTIFSQGDPADAVFYIQCGMVKLRVVSRSGKEAIVAMLPEGSFFGECCLADQPFRISSAYTVQRSTIIRVEKATMLDALQRRPEFSRYLLSYLLSRSIRMEADLLDQLFNSSERRLARLLLLLSKFGLAEEPVPISATISQGTLAEMIGTTRPRVSHFLNRFRNLGFIDYDGGVMHVHSSLARVLA